MTKRTPIGRLATLLFAVLAVGSCGDDITFPPDFDSSLGINLDAMTRTPSGLYYQDLVVGTGAVASAGKSATVGYSGWLPNGINFDSGSFSFTVGVGQVVPGFDEGVVGMQVGGKRRLVIPPDLGYGDRANGPIPANSTLVFEIELQKIG
jgi:peptidylprolyl isomerase